MDFHLVDVCRGGSCQDFRPARCPATPPKVLEVMVQSCAVHASGVGETVMLPAISTSGCDD